MGTALKNPPEETDAFAVLNVDRWFFYVLAQEQVKKLATPAGTIREKMLKEGGVASVRYPELKQSVDVLIDGRPA
jgi:hypothetical protein